MISYEWLSIGLQKEGEGMDTAGHLLGDCSRRSVGYLAFMGPPN